MCLHLVGLCGRHAGLTRPMHQEVIVHFLSFLGRTPHGLGHAALPSCEDRRRRVGRIVDLGAGQRTRSDRHTGGDYSASENERAKPLTFPLIRNGAEESPSAALRYQVTDLCNGTTQTDALRSGPWVSGRPARRGAGAPVGQSNTPLSAPRSRGQCANWNSRSAFNAPDRYPTGPRL
jgi:hypothetical protein